MVLSRVQPSCPKFRKSFQSQRGNDLLIVTWDNKLNFSTSTTIVSAPFVPPSGPSFSPPYNSAVNAKLEANYDFDSIQVVPPSILVNPTSHKVDSWANIEISQPVVSKPSR